MTKNHYQETKIATKATPSVTVAASLMLAVSVTAMFLSLGMMLAGTGLLNLNSNINSPFINSATNVNKADNIKENFINHPKNKIYSKTVFFVKFKKDSSDSLSKQIDVPLKNIKINDSVDNMLKKYQVEEIKPTFKSMVAYKERIKNLKNIKYQDLSAEDRSLVEREKKYPQVTIPTDVDRVFTLRVPKELAIEQVVDDFSKNANVEYASLNYLRNIELVPNDEQYGSQWSHKMINSEKAWDVSTGDKNVVVAVIDTGVDLHHEDLADNLVSGWDFVDLTDEVKDFSTDIQLYPDTEEDYYIRDNDPMDAHGHGTHVSGIIAGVGNNSVGISGVAFNSSIMPLRAGFKYLYQRQEVGGLMDDDIIDAINFAVEKGVDIINMSFGGDEANGVQQEALNNAYNNGVILVAAAGNENTDIPGYPASFDTVISVSATDSNDRRAGFSNYGATVDVAAPGEFILSTLLGNTYAVWSGTSMAAPHVAGLAVLLRSVYPNDTNSEIYGRIISTGDNIDEKNPTHINELGLRINLYKALTSVAGPNLIINEFSLNELNGNGNNALDAGETFELSVDLKNTWLKAQNVTAKLISENNNITVLQDTSSYGNIDSFQIARSSNLYIIKASDDTPINTEATLRLDIMTSDGFTMSQNMQVIVTRAIIEKEKWFFPFRDHDGEYSPVLADVDMDGKDEIITQIRTSFFDSEYPGKYLIYIFRSDGTLLDGWNPKIIDVDTMSVPVIGDVDKDGKKEIIYVTRDGVWDGNRWKFSTNMVMFHADGSVYKSWSVGEFMDVNSPTLGDINNDGFDEILYGSYYLFVFDHEGNPLEGWEQPFSELVQQSGFEWLADLFVSSPVVADIDKDGYLEIFIGSKDHRLFGLRYDKTLIPGWPVELEMGGVNQKPIVADVNNDGEYEIITGTANFTHIFKKDGSEFAKWPNPIRTPVGEHSKTVADMDNDGQLEVISSPNYYVQMYVFRNNGSVVTGWPQNVYWGLNSKQVLVDLDNDGYSEILSASIETAWGWYYDGRRFSGIPSMAAVTISAGDLDKDNNVDIVIQNNNGIYLFNTLSRGKDAIKWTGEYFDEGGNNWLKKEPIFLRGDVNNDGAVDITDPINILGFLFTGNPAELSCMDAADVNDSGEINITDGIHLLNFLFNPNPTDGTDKIPAPYPDKGYDPTLDDLGCNI